MCRFAAPALGLLILFAVACTGTPPTPTPAQTFAGSTEEPGFAAEDESRAPKLGSVPQHKGEIISARGNHTCMVKTDGSIACWGYNDDGQATPPSGEFTSVSAGIGHTCGVTADGSVKCWGDDYYGQATPPFGEFTSVSAAVSHTCGVRRDSSVECWGDDAYGKATPMAGEFSAVSTGGTTPAG